MKKPQQNSGASTSFSIVPTIAWRYLFSRDEGGATSLITGISLAGVAIGVAVLIATMAVMDGASTLLSAKISNLYAHVRIQNSPTPETSIPPEMLEKIRAISGVTMAEPIVQREAMLMTGGDGDWRAEGVTLVSARELGPVNLYHIKREGDPIRLERGQMLVGSALLKRLGAKGGDTIMAITPNSGSRPVSIPLTIVDSFDSDYYEFDSITAFVAESTMRAAFGVGEGADFIHIALDDPMQAARVKDDIRKFAGPQYMIKTWSEANHNFFEGIKWQKRMLFVILLLIILVAAFNIIGSLILMVIAKTRQIGILRAVGAKRRTIIAIFLLDGSLVGLAGTALGLALGVAICAALPHIPFGIPEEIYNFNRLPVEIRPVSAAAVALASCVICALASLLPALQAGRLKPVEALRYD